MRVTDHCMMNLDSSPDFTGNRVAVLGDKTTGHGNCNTTEAVWETVLILKGESDEEVASNQEYADNSQTPDKYTLRDCEPNNPYQRFVLEVQCDLEVATDKSETVTPDVSDCNTDHPVFTISSFVAGRTAMDDYPERQPSCTSSIQVW
ncbi:hypothetical protein SARC_09840 [Sphaeroforma arctica JP610]|uniref:Uncharacterized protein n=1 Tax=Sphaeroforma arctica JP610 TaxID=667725 RepID=A0A0L0FMI7_9EUKA|nr:hypothetical protein SARC_09840 [Sphaeroforma arctica JP610]KNC77706.1 hypothetical protein SARC_09840 [Sphaeroforma arctica JP610]|eukprot:XP_014151608.1 hypothetical protein SARC_09840 [Sphaeroforma arctica JP610]